MIWSISCQGRCRSPRFDEGDLYAEGAELDPQQSATASIAYFEAL